MLFKIIFFLRGESAYTADFHTCPDLHLARVTDRSLHKMYNVISSVLRVSPWYFLASFPGEIQANCIVGRLDVTHFHTSASCASQLRSCLYMYNYMYYCTCITHTHMYLFLLLTFFMYFHLSLPLSLRCSPPSSSAGTELCGALPDL